MTLLDLFIVLVIAGVIGSLGQALAGISRGGCLLSIVIGFIGAALGAWLARTLRLPELFTLGAGGTQFPIVWSVVGATIFVAILGLLTPRRPRS